MITNMPQDTPTMNPADFARGITLNIQQAAASRSEPMFRAVIFHNAQKVSEVTGTRNEVGKHIMSVVAERLFTGPSGPLGDVQGLLGKLLGGKGWG
jgi:hypothetical protein